jgi:hypothetical protein
MKMNMAGQEMDVPMTPEQSAQLEQTLNQGFGQGTLPANYEVVSCDGQQSYADLVSGEQVTVTYTPEGLGPITSKILFAPDGKMAGSYTETEQGPALSVMDEYVTDSSGVPTHITMKIYTLEGETATLVSDMVIDTTSYNQPVDESLFSE